MRNIEKDRSLQYIPADEKRLAGARDVYQTAVRLRPVLDTVFKVGGLLDSFLLDHPHIEDRDMLQTEQRVAGKVISQMYAARVNQQVYCAVEVGYLRHLFNATHKTHPSIISMLGVTREIALRSSMHLELPPAPAVTFEPVQIPDPKELVYAGVFAAFTRPIDDIQPMRTSIDAYQPQLLWKIDPTPSYFYPIDNRNLLHPVHQGDLIISHKDAAEINVGADYMVFFDPQSDTYRSAIYEYADNMRQV